MATQGHSVEVRDGCAEPMLGAEGFLRCPVPRGRGGVLVLGAAGGREAGGESGHCLVCGSGEEIRRVERSGRGWSAFISSADSRVDVRKARFSERCTRAP